MVGDPKFEDAQVIPDFDYARYAELLGLKAVRIHKKDDIVPGLEEALAADRPVVIEALSDPEVPPLLLHIKFDQAKKLWSAMIKGDPHRDRVIKQSVKELWASSGIRK